MKNTNEKEIKKITDKLLNNRPEIQSDPGFKSSLEEILKQKAEDMGNRKKNKILAFITKPAYLSIAAAALLVVTIGFPSADKNKGVNTIIDEIVELEDDNLKLEASPEIKVESITTTSETTLTTDTTTIADITPTSIEKPIITTQIKDTKDKETKIVSSINKKDIETANDNEIQFPESIMLSLEESEEFLYESPQVKRTLMKQSKAPIMSSSVETKWGLSMDMDEATQGFNSTDDEFNTEEYSKIVENRFLLASETPLSTFSIDVDTASYANVRRYINNGALPPKDSVRIEEMINYFNYDYPLPTDDKPFSVYTEVSQSPWNNKNYLVHIGLQGKDIPKNKLPPSNIVFLIDVSGSMSAENKLGLLVKSVDLMLEQFTEKDRIAIVAYAGAAGVVLPSTYGDKKEIILEAFQRLSAGGSTAGAQGIELAYQIASDNFIINGNNRVIIATDGDFNVGTSSTGDLTRLIEDKRDSGIYLTVLGLGMGNYKDSKMESLADSGNGNYAYIDSLLEAQKVLVDDIKKTLFVIAKDVKIQVEFNPAIVSEYRLIGYESRLLRDRDFSDDKIDAGDIGSGHTVTAIYEVVPRENNSEVKTELKYQDTVLNENGKNSGEILNLSLRYKEPKEESSKLIEVQVKSDVIPIKNSSVNFKFSAAVAAYGQILRGSEYMNDYTFDEVIGLVKESMVDDEYGYRSEFYTLLRKVNLLSK